MFRKGSETLVEEVNKALNEMIDDGTYLKISRNGLVKMFLNNIIADPDRTATIIEIAQSSLQPLLEGAILYTIPLTIITFICGLDS